MYLEGHRQNDAKLSAAEDATVLIRFGEMTVALLNYDEVLTSNRLRALHDAAWDEDVRLSNEFNWQKIALNLEEFCADDGQELPLQHVDVIYFDAFGPRTQPERWTTEVFTALAKRLRSGGF